MSCQDAEKALNLEALRTVGPFTLIPPCKYQVMTEAQQRAHDQAQVMLAFSQGKTIEFRYNTLGDWRTMQPSEVHWDFIRIQYRIAPEPQEVWLWVKEGQHPIHETYWHQTIEDLKILGYTKKLFREVTDK